MKRGREPQLFTPAESSPADQLDAGLPAGKRGRGRQREKQDFTELLRPVFRLMTSETEMLIQTKKQSSTLQLDGQASITGPHTISTVQRQRISQYHFKERC